MKERRSGRKARRLPQGSGMRTRPRHAPGASCATAADGRMRRPVLRFLLIFSVLAGSFYALTVFSPLYRERCFPWMLRATARPAGVMLACLGQKTTVDGALISSPRFAVRIVRGCDAVEVTALFACAVLAFPSSWRRKIAGIVAGSLFLVLLNHVRIVTLFLIGVHVPKVFGVMHVDVWQGLFIVLALVLWLLWLLWTTGDRVCAAQAS